jgi:hypothetical protein
MEPPAEREPTEENDRTPIRASDREREAIVQRLQGAFVEGRIDDAEFDERMRAALTARTRADLDRIVGDLPRASAAVATVPARTSGKLVLAMKGGVTRAGRPRPRGRLQGRGRGPLDPGPGADRQALIACLAWGACGGER